MVSNFGDRLKPCSLIIKYLSYPRSQERSIFRLSMTEATLIPDASTLKSQLETEIAKYQAEIYLRQAKIHALDVFGNRDTVEDWLAAKNPALDGMAPLELLDSAAGLERVIDLVNAIRHGVFM
jgi:putative toxin-antitoxin system antitoxin component (TIGR02293 family)